MDEKLSKLIETEDSLYSTFVSAMKILSHIEMSVYPSVLSICVPLGSFMSLSLNLEENQSLEISNENLKENFVQSLIKACLLIIGNENAKSVQAFKYAVKRYGPVHKLCNINREWRGE